MSFQNLIWALTKLRLKEKGDSMWETKMLKFIEINNWSCIYILLRAPIRYWGHIVLKNRILNEILSGRYSDSIGIHQSSGCYCIICSIKIFKFLNIKQGIDSVKGCVACCSFKVLILFKSPRAREVLSVNSGSLIPVYNNKGNPIYIVIQFVEYFWKA